MSSLSSLDPRVRPWAEWFVSQLRAYGFNPVVTSTRRSAAAQRKLYAEWKAGRNPYPVAVPGTSRHEKGQAWDMVVKNPALVGEAWNSIYPGVFRWAGPKDPVHFEIRL